MSFRGVLSKAVAGPRSERGWLFYRLAKADSEAISDTLSGSASSDCGRNHCPATTGIWLLVIVSCVKNKIWDVDPSAPARSPAGTAYVSSYFIKNRAYARTFGEGWCILSAKFGLVLPGEEIENYNITFKHRDRKSVV